MKWTYLTVSDVNILTQWQSDIKETGLHWRTLFYKWLFHLTIDYKYLAYFKYSYTESF